MGIVFYEYTCLHFQPALPEYECYNIPSRKLHRQASVVWTDLKDKRTRVAHVNGIGIKSTTRTVRRMQHEYSTTKNYCLKTCISNIVKYARRRSGIMVKYANEPLRERFGGENCLYFPEKGMVAFVNYVRLIFLKVSYSVGYDRTTTASCVSLKNFHLFHFKIHR